MPELIEHPTLKMKEQFVLRAVRQILRIYDLGHWLQGHIDDLKPLLLSTYNNCA